MSLLPDQFSDLESKFRDWILPTDGQRVKRRMIATLPEAREFYDELTPRVPDLLGYIDRFSIDDLPAEAKNCWYLLASFIQAAMAVEFWRDTFFRFGLDETRNKRLDLHNSHPLL